VAEVPTPETATVTLTVPVGPAGAVVVIEVVFAVRIVACVVPKSTVSFALVPENPVPVIVTGVPLEPASAESEVTETAPVTFTTGSEARFTAEPEPFVELEEPAVNV
jgi:hypothetical protein